MPDLVVGIDGGGTKTRVECFDEGGLECLGVGEGAACNIVAMSIADALASVREALQNASVEPASVRSACAAVAGYSHEARRMEFRDGLAALLPQARVSVAPDYEAAFRSALPGGSGVLVIAGTGSIAFARYAGFSEDKTLSARAGGYGYLIDDGGSGYGVGRQALAAVLAAQDGLGEATELDAAVARTLGWAESEMQRDAVIREVYFGSLDRARIASLAECVAVCAAAGDAVAAKILMHAGGALARLAEGAYRQVFTSRSLQPVQVARVGSLWRAGHALTTVFERSLARFAPAAVLIEPSRHEPAWGAAQMAVELLRGEHSSRRNSL